MLVGFIAISPFSGRQLYSAQAPRRRPVNAKTWSPFLTSFTAFPTDSISPASSCPSILFLGPLKPNAIRAMSCHDRGSFMPRNSQSPAVTVAAWTLISTSLSSGTGFCSSLSLRTSGGPYLVHTIAFIRGPPSFLTVANFIVPPIMGEGEGLGSYLYSVQCLLYPVYE